MINPGDCIGSQGSYTALTEYIKNSRVFSTHSHHLKDEDFKDFGLTKLLENSYVSWSGLDIPSEAAGSDVFFKKVRRKSYYVWLAGALQEMYDLAEPLSEETWDLYDRKIRQAHRNPEQHLKLLKELCGYEAIVLDAFWRPGDDNGHADIFRPTFRINSFLYGYDPTAADHNGNNATLLYDINMSSLDTYIEGIRQVIIIKKENGCVALKCALAYDRSLDFKPVTKETSEKIWSQEQKREEDIRQLQDYIFDQICKIAADLDMPLQCHTGLGLLEETRAMHLHSIIDRNPQTKFVLFHCSFPWTDDVLALLHNYSNVYPDLCWLPLQSPVRAAQFIGELIDVGISDRVCWGCDTWTSEESFGALLAIRHTLAQALSAKVDTRMISFEEACQTADDIMYNNAAALYLNRG